LFHVIAGPGAVQRGMSSNQSHPDPLWCIRRADVPPVLHRMYERREARNRSPARFARSSCLVE